MMKIALSMTIISIFLLLIQMQHVLGYRLQHQRLLMFVKD